jgi:oligopeptide transport system ATP-binding protein
LITHDLGVVAEVCQRVIVMYAGKIVEQGSAKDLFANPQHPYTIGLLRSIPRLGEQVKDTLATIGGLPPDLLAPPTGCRFRPRCPRRQELCEQEPPLAETQPGQRAACWFPGPDAQPMAEASAAGTAVSA